MRCHVYGMIARSRLTTIQTAFPSGGTYAELTSDLEAASGEAFGTAVVLSKLGVSCTIDGAWLPEGQRGDRIEQLLKEREVGTGLLKRTDLECFDEIVISDRKHRTSFGNYKRLLAGAAVWNEPNEAAFREADMLSIDPFFGAASEKAVELACRLGLPFVSIDTPLDAEATRHAVANILSESFLKREFEGQDPRQLFECYQESAAEGCLNIFTFGSRGCSYAVGTDDEQRVSAFKVPTVDTCGAGDAYRAGVIYGLLNDWTAPEIVRFASATAALVSARSGGTLSAPTQNEVHRLLRENSRGD